MNPIIAFENFHKKIGPLVFYSYPKNLLSDEISAVLTGLMDSPRSESLFIHGFDYFSSLNYYFVFQSIRANN